MPLDLATVSNELEQNEDKIRQYTDPAPDIINEYVTAFRRFPDEFSHEQAQAALDPVSHPGAYPTPQAHTGSVTIPHEVSTDWTNHEQVNDWAETILADVPVLAVDGSQIRPTTEFSVPLAYVQAAWALNYHKPEGKLDRGISGKLLPPAQITEQDADGTSRYVETSLVDHHRFEHEGTTLINRIEALADEHDPGTSPPPVVIYDGPLVASFASPLDHETRSRYLNTLSRVIAASKHHEIPLVGYVANSKSSDLANMVQHLYGPDELSTDLIIPDAYALLELMTPWGDQTPPFVVKRDGTTDELETTYNGISYSFTESILFSYLNIPSGTQLDKIEFPQWLCQTDGPADYNSMYQYTVDIVRAQGGIGRGYPELLQQVDADAVIDTADRTKFYRLIQQWADSNDIPIEWDSKSLSKELRRR